MNVDVLSEFKPTNELEKALVQAQQGELEMEAFMQVLMTSSLFVPVEDKEQIGGLQVSSKAKFLSLDDEDGQKILISFSDPERGKVFLQDYPDYKGGLLVDIPWLIEKLGVGYGISLNPSLTVGFDLEPQMLQALAEQLQ